MKHLSSLMKSDVFNNRQLSSFSLKEVANQKTSKHQISEKDEEEIEKRLTKLKQVAYETGFSAGERAGHALGLSKLERAEKNSLKTGQLLLKAIGETNVLKGVILKESEEDILMIALAIARRVIGEEVKQNPEIILNNIQKAIKKIGKTEKLIIRLHPQDIEIVSQHAEAIIHPNNQDTALRFEPDAKLSRGDCIVEGEERMIDLRQKTQFKHIEAALSERGHL